jgi:predicted ATPase
MGRLIVEAAKRGVYVIVETHSSLLLRAVQTLVAERFIRPGSVVLHWFARRPDDGVTVVNTVSPDERGTLGKWPQDFDDTTLSAESRYLDAAGTP